MRKFFEIGGLVAAAVLIAFGVAAIVMGVNGRSTVQDSLKLEQIVGSPDMTPSAIAAEAKQAGLPASISLPTMDVAGKPINTGDRARAFASLHAHPHAGVDRRRAVLRRWPLLRDGGDGKGTNDATGRSAVETAARSTTPPATSG